MIKVHLILSQTRLIFSRLTDFSSVLTEFNSIWSDFWSDSDPNPIQTRPAPWPGYIRNKTLKIPFLPQTGRDLFGSLTRRFPATPSRHSGDLFFLSRSLYFLRRTHFRLDSSDATSSDATVFHRHDFLRRRCTLSSSSAVFLSRSLLRYASPQDQKSNTSFIN